MYVCIYIHYTYIYTYRKEQLPTYILTSREAARRLLIIKGKSVFQ